MTRDERIHHLFNELHRELVEASGYAGSKDSNPYIRAIALKVDAAHHDYTNITLEEVA
jgi:hypothetical protein